MFFLAIVVGQSTFVTKHRQLLSGMLLRPKGKSSTAQCSDLVYNSKYE